MTQCGLQSLHTQTTPNPRPHKEAHLDLSLSQATEGFILAKECAGCSPHTIRNYKLALRRLQEFLESRDPPLTNITSDDLQGFIRQLQTTKYPQPGAVERPPKALSSKTVRNIHTALSSLWTWAIQEGHAETHVPKTVTPPKPQEQQIEPLTEDQVRAILDAVNHSAPWKNSPGTRHTRPQLLRLRDRATLLFLLDTGVRVSELVNLTMNDVDLHAGTALVRGKSRLGSGKGKKRTVYLGKKTRKALWQYLTARSERVDTDPLFATLDGRKQNRCHLHRHLRRLGDRAGVPRVYPHRFRHTFAINFLRQLPNIYALQRIMGHSDLKMMRRYLALAQADCEAAHRVASPVDNWHL